MLSEPSRATRPSIATTAGYALMQVATSPTQRLLEHLIVTVEAAKKTRITKTHYARVGLELCTRIDGSLHCFEFRSQTLCCREFLHCTTKFGCHFTAASFDRQYFIFAICCVSFSFHWPEASGVHYGLHHAAASTCCGNVARFRAAWMNASKVFAGVHTGSWAQTLAAISHGVVKLLMGMRWRARSVTV